MMPVRGALWPAPDDPPLQFGVRGLLVLQAVCALFLGLLLLFGVFALLGAFVAMLAYEAVQVPPAHRPVKRLVIDICGGLLLPVLCLYYDPGIVRPQSAGTTLLGLSSGPVGLANWLMLATQMSLFGSWLILGRRAGPLAGVFCGALWVGCLYAVALGMIMLPLSLIGLVAYGIGLLGLTPFVTASVFGRNAMRAWRVAALSPSPWRRYVAPWVGAALAVAVPLLLYWLVGPAFEPWVQSLPKAAPFSF